MSVRNRFTNEIYELMNSLYTFLACAIHGARTWRIEDNNRLENGSRDREDS